MVITGKINNGKTSVLKLIVLQDGVISNTKRANRFVRENILTFCHDAQEFLRKSSASFCNFSVTWTIRCDHTKAALYSGKLWKPVQISTSF